MTRLPVENGWCILRTSGPRTLKLAASLVGAGFDAWTPVERVRRRIPHSKSRRELDAPIMPTFVFVRADRVSDLLRVLAQPMNPHPAFSVFRFQDGYPLVADQALASLRAAEEKARRTEQKKRRHVFGIGESVRVGEGAAAGMSGVVEGGDGKFALVAFGGSIRLKIATFLLAVDPLHAAPALTGNAA